MLSGPLGHSSVEPGKALQRLVLLQPVSSAVGCASLCQNGHGVGDCAHRRSLLDLFPGQRVREK